MPDIWTRYPEIVRDLLEEAGLKCGAEPRILKGRDPDWTCLVDGKKMWGDLYIHHVDEILKAPPPAPSGQSSIPGWEFGVVGVLLAAVIGQAWVIKKLKRNAEG